MCLLKPGPQAPVAQLPHMALKRGTDPQLLCARTRNQYSLRIVGPVQGDGGGVGYEEFVEGDGGVDADHAVAHARPGEIVHPVRVWGEELGRPWGEPIWEPVEGFLRGGD